MNMISIDYDCDTTSVYPAILKIQKNSLYGRFSMSPTTIKKAAHRNEWECSADWRKRDEIIKWCQNAFGDSGRNKKCRWRYNYVTDHIYFKHESDVILFTLKWVNQ